MNSQSSRSSVVFKMFGTYFILQAAFTKDVIANNIFDITGVEFFQSILQVKTTTKEDATNAILSQNQFSHLKIGSKNYILPTDLRVNWFEAASICRRHNAQLANIENEAEFKAVTKYITENDRGKVFWLSGNDLRKEGSFLWGDTGKEMTYNNWRDKEPSNSNNIEHCVHLKREGSFGMNDANCQSHFRFICVVEKSANRPTTVDATTNYLVKLGTKEYIIPKDKKVNWFEASDICHSYNAQLANIEDEAEMNTVSAYLSNSDGDGHFWISGNDLQKEGQWLWGDTGKSMIYTKWTFEEPNNFNDIEHCVQLKKETSFKGQIYMNDAFCMSPNKFICVK